MVRYSVYAVARVVRLLHSYARWRWVAQFLRCRNACTTTVTTTTTAEEIGPRPLHRFTPPPEGETDYDDEEDEYTDDEEEYSDDEEGEEYSEEEGEGGGRDSKAPYKDELLQMVSKTLKRNKFIKLF